MKRLLLALLLIAAPGFGWGGDGNPADGISGCGGVYIPAGLATAPAPTQWYPGDWSRSRLRTELLFNNVAMNGLRLESWRNTGSNGSAGSYSQYVGVNQPIVGSGTDGIWMDQGQFLETSNIEYSESPGTGVTRYLVCRPVVMGAYKYFGFVAGHYWGAYSPGTTIWQWDSHQNTELDLSCPNVMNAMNIIVQRREAGSQVWIPGQEGIHAYVYFIVNLNGTTYQKRQQLTWNDWNEGGSASVTASIKQIGYSQLNDRGMMGNVYLYLAYDTKHTDAEVLATTLAINRYLRRCHVAEATIY